MPATIGYGDLMDFSHFRKTIHPDRLRKQTLSRLKRLERNDPAPALHGVCGGKCMHAEIGPHINEQIIRFQETLNQQASAPLQVATIKKACKNCMIRWGAQDKADF